MIREDDMNYDFEKLRKRLISRNLLTGFVTGLFSDVATTNNAYNATPEQLLLMAKRYNINMDRYKIKKPEGKQ